MISEVSVGTLCTTNPRLLSGSKENRFGSHGYRAEEHGLSAPVLWCAGLFVSDNVLPQLVQAFTSVAVVSLI